MASLLATASDADLKRMALLWLYSDMSATNWEAAHMAYDPAGNTKLASFKTVSNRSLAKYKKAVEKGTSLSGEEGGDAPKKTATATATTKKRKAADEGEGPPKVQGKTSGRNKKSTQKKIDAEEDVPAVKDEEDEDVLT